MKKVIILLMIFSCIFACNLKDEYIQDIYVNELIDLSLPEYDELNIIGNSIFIEGGLEGIIIYRGVGDSYKVYDRNCSYQPSGFR